MVARNQIQRPLEEMGIQYKVATNGKEALEMLQGWKSDREMLDRLAMIISDVEMPEMDGYTLVTKIREDAELGSSYIVLHTSLSGVFNSSIIEKVDADRFISKYDPNALAESILERLRELKEA